jgi:hypothetical protein
MMMMLAIDCICDFAVVLFVTRTIDDIGPEMVWYRTTLIAAAIAIPAKRMVNTLPDWAEPRRRSGGDLPGFLFHLKNRLKTLPLRT